MCYNTKCEEIVGDSRHDLLNENGRSDGVERAGKPTPGNLRSEHDSDTALMHISPQTRANLNPGGSSGSSQRVSIGWGVHAATAPL